MERQNQLARKRGKKGWTYYLFIPFILSTLLVLLCGAFLFFYYSHQLPDFEPLKDRKFNAYSTVYSEEDEVVGKFLMGQSNSRPL